MLKAFYVNFNILKQPRSEIVFSVHNTTKEEILDLLGSI